jgi:dihydrofolate synthase/folylpolyglutamate synthase
MITHPVLEQLASHGVRLGLDRVRAFLQFLGEPHRAFPVVHVAGTNGKGSTCMLVTSALAKAGYRVGTTLSPHLEAVNERIRFDGLPVDDPRLVEGIEALDRARQEWALSAGVESDPLTYFEFVTVLAFVLFAQEAVDVAVVEVGMGGRLDATNVVHPLVCAIPTIGLDHAEDLGGTLAEIAGEKAGILKRQVPVVIGPLPAEAREVVEARAKGLASPLWKPGSDLIREQRKVAWNFRTPAGSLSDVRLGLDGQHQGANGVVALGVLHRLRQQGFLISDEAIRDGFASVSFGGRLEELLPGLIVDGAHNVEGTQALAAWLQTRPRPKNRILLFGMGNERDPVAVIKPLLPHVDEVVTTRSRHPKAREPGRLAEMLADLEVVLSDGGPIEEALPEVYAEADETLVTGSLFVVGAARTLVREGALEGLAPGQGAALVEDEV